MCVQSANVVAIHFQGKIFSQPTLWCSASHPRGATHQESCARSNKCIRYNNFRGINKPGKFPIDTTKRRHRKASTKKSKQVWRFHREPTEIPSLSSKKAAAALCKHSFSFQTCPVLSFVFGLRVRIYRIFGSVFTYTLASRRNPLYTQRLYIPITIVR